MTDNEIIKALEHCTSSTTSEACNGCPLFSTTVCTEMENGLMIYALNLINRQKADIEEWKTTAEKWYGEYHKTKEELKKSKMYENSAHKLAEEYIAKNHTIKAETIKEFAENAKKNHLAIFNTIYSHTHFCGMIDNLAKEMTEGKDES